MHFCYSVCYYTQSGYLQRYLTRYRSTVQYYTTSCGFLGWSRCRRTRWTIKPLLLIFNLHIHVICFRYQSVSYSSSYNQLVYTQVSTCCSGYTGSPQIGCQGWIYKITVKHSTVSYMNHKSLDFVKIVKLCRDNNSWLITITCSECMDFFLFALPSSDEVKPISQSHVIATGVYMQLIACDIASYLVFKLLCIIYW